jgi:hypothetical protein
MEPGGSLPHSQEPATCPYTEPDQSSGDIIYGTYLQIFICRCFVCWKWLTRWRREVSNPNHPSWTNSRLTRCHDANLRAWVWRLCPRKWLSSEQNRCGAYTVAGTSAGRIAASDIFCLHLKLHVWKWKSYDLLRHEVAQVHRNVSWAPVSSVFRGGQLSYQSTRRRNPEVCNVNIQMYRRQ